MNNNLKALTEKIYTEGIEKAEQQSEIILKQARETAQRIISDAEKEAADMLAQAETDCNNLKKKNEGEMRLAARQALGSLKQQITDLLIWKVTSVPIREAFEEKEFVHRIIEKLVEYWLASFGREERLTVLLPDRDFEALQRYFQLKSQEILQNRVILKSSDSMEDGFVISPEDGRFKVKFTSEDFENYFKAFARPGAYRLLFGKEA